MLDALIKQLKRHEGFRAFPYKDTVGKLTIGYGRNLDDVGITEQEGRALLLNDVEIAVKEVNVTWPWILDHDEVRQQVIYNVAFNMGVPRLSGFKKMFAAMEDFDYEKAAEEMLDSKWATQVGDRATELAGMMRDE